MLSDLESVVGWTTARVNRPVLILGSLDGVETGIRQLIRQRPLDTIRVDHLGQTITLPTEPEMLRVKAAQILKRNATRDYLDFVATAHHLGDEGTAAAFYDFDALYPQPNAEFVGWVSTHRGCRKRWGEPHPTKEICLRQC